MDKSDWVNPFPNVTTARGQARNDLSLDAKVTKASSGAGVQDYVSNIPPDIIRSPPPAQENHVGGSGDENDLGCDLTQPDSKWSWLIFMGVLGLALLSTNLLLSFYDVKVKGDCILPPNQMKQRWERLEAESKARLFGQHLAVDGGLGAIYGHLVDPEPPKALVLSFHGWLGSGKTFFSHMIAKNLFEGGLRNSHVKAFLGPRHFLLDPITTQQNKEKLLQLVEKSMGSCGRSLFIFDEADMMPVEVLNALTPFLGHQGILDGVDYRRGIFIFISNSGAQGINNITLQALRDGRKREDLKIQDFKDVFSKELKQTIEHPEVESPVDPMPSIPWTHQLRAVVHSIWVRLWSPFGSSCNCTIPHQMPHLRTSRDPGGLFASEISGRGLVDHYVPFLPLQRSHVLLCIQRELRRRNIHNQSPSNILEGMNSFSSSDGEMFAQEGCKNVAPQVSRYVTQAHTSLFKKQT